MTRALLTLGLLLSLLGSGFAQHTPAAPAKDTTHAAASRPAPSADALWAELMAGNKRFVAGKPRARALVPLRRKLAAGQSPHVIVLACSDSRVAPEILFDQTLGDLFVIRTAGNVVDTVALGSIEYAVDHLHSTVLVVLGHQKCGAVQAACSGENMPSKNLDAIVEKINPAVTQAKSYAKGDGLVEAAIRENVHQSAKDVLVNSAILREAVKAGKLKVIEAEYEFDTGKVARLETPKTGRD